MGCTAQPAAASLPGGSARARSKPSDLHVWSALRIERSSGQVLRTLSSAIPGDYDGIQFSPSVELRDPRVSKIPGAIQVWGMSAEPVSRRRSVPNLSLQETE